MTLQSYLIETLYFLRHRLVSESNKVKSSINMDDLNNELVIKAQCLQSIFNSLMSVQKSEEEDAPLLQETDAFDLEALYSQIYIALATVNEETHGKLTRHSASMALLLNSAANENCKNQIALQVSIELLFDHLIETTALITRSQGCPHEISILLEAFMKHFKMNMVVGPVLQPYMSGLPGLKTVFEAIAKVGSKNFFAASMNLIAPAGMAMIEAGYHLARRTHWRAVAERNRDPEQESILSAEPYKGYVALDRLEQTVREQVALNPALIKQYKVLRRESITNVGHFLMLLFLGVLFFISMFNWAKLNIPHFADGENSNLLPIIFLMPALFFKGLNYYLS